MSVTDLIIQLIAATLGSFGYALIYGLKKQYYLTASLGGFLSWGIFLAVGTCYDSIFASCLAASVFAAVYSEIAARIKKAPTTLFFITSVIPLIPGRTLYYTCSNAVMHNWDSAKQYANTTLQYAVAIAAGACIIWSIALTVGNIKKYKNKNSKTA